jgi:hypothetical protein
MSNLTHYIACRFEKNSISDQQRLTSLQEIFNTTKRLSAAEMHYAATSAIAVVQQSCGHDSSSGGDSAPDWTHFVPHGIRGA